MFLLTYRVVPVGTIPERILLGEDLQNQAVIQLGPGQPVVFPTEAYLLQVKAEEEVLLDNGEKEGAGGNEDRFKGRNPCEQASLPAGTQREKGS